MSPAGVAVGPAARQVPQPGHARAGKKDDLRRLAGGVLAREAQASHGLQVIQRQRAPHDLPRAFVLHFERHFRGPYLIELFHDVSSLSGSFAAHMIARFAFVVKLAFGCPGA